VHDLDAFDPPAAHSMDCAWYAVDADGRVARFETGEEGGVPLEAAVGAGAGDASFEEDVLYAFLAARRLARGPIPAIELTTDDRLLVVLDTVQGDSRGATYRAATSGEHPADALLARFDPVVVQEAGPRVVMTRKVVRASRAREIASAPGVVAVLPISSASDDSDDRAAEAGLFVFENPEPGDPGRYTRLDPPGAPLALEELPSAVREAIGKTRIPIRFADTPEIELGDHFETIETWGGTATRRPAAEGEAPQWLPIERGRTAVRPASGTPRLGGRTALAIGIVIVVSILYWLTR
jgi:hypothetical protein